jgi:hypothetical protein
MSLSTRALGVLQWAGLIGGAVVLALDFLVGYWIAEAQCGGPGAAGDIGNDTWQGALAGASGLLVVLALAASVVVFLRTRGAEPGDGPLEEQALPREPYGRLHFFALAAMVANICFLGVIVLSVVGTTANVVCRQS